MNSTLNEFESHLALLDNTTAKELEIRLSGFLTWMEQQSTIEPLIKNLESKVNIKEILVVRMGRSAPPPQASSLVEIQRVGLEVMRACQKRERIDQFAYNYGLAAYLRTETEIAHRVLNNYVRPFLTFVLTSLPADVAMQSSESALIDPPAIFESLAAFRRDHPNPKLACFLMMKFGKTQAHDAIVTTLRETLLKFGMKALRADDKEYHDDLFPNVQTYMHGCAFGIAILERIEAEEFNPNVSLEVGYMMAHRKPVLLLVDSTLKRLQTDLVGKLYRTFDFQDPYQSIPKQLKSWLEDKGLV